MKSNIQGQCPHCTSDNLNYDSIQVEKDVCYYPFTCEECGQEGSEWYEMSFIGHNIIDKDGNENEVSEIISQRGIEGGHKLWTKKE